MINNQNQQYYPSKDIGISFVRFIALSLIVSCHILQFYGNGLAWVFNIGVQIFLFISGWLYGLRFNCQTIKDCVRYLYNNWKKIFISFWIFLTVILIVYAIYDPQLININQILGYYFGSRQLQGCGHLWFIPYIFLCYCITPLLYVLSNYFKRRNAYWVWSVITILVLSTILHYYSPFNVIWINCFILGFFITCYTREDKSTTVLGFDANPTVIYFGLVAALLFALCYLVLYLRNQGTLQYGNAILYQYVYDVRKLFGGIIITIVLRRVYLIFNEKCCFSNYLDRILKYSDTYSYQIYITHHIFVLSPICVLLIDWPRRVTIPIAIMAALISAVILKRISNVLIKRLNP